MRGTAPIETKVGRYVIQIPPISPLAEVYRKNPNYSGQLGRLAIVLHKKYPDLAALDIGANIGDTACVIQSAAKIPLGCIEGDEFAFGFLQRNVKQFRNVTAHKLFLSEKSETISATMEKTGWNTTIVPDKGNSAPAVKMVSLDDFLAGLPSVANIKLLKIDTEGFDCPIIRGGLKFIQSVQPAISFEYNRDNMRAIGEQGLDTLALLEDAGYDRAAIHDFNGRFLCMTRMSDHPFIQDLHDYADGKLGCICYFDITLFHRDDGDVADAFASIERERRPG